MYVVEITSTRTSDCLGQLKNQISSYYICHRSCIYIQVSAYKYFMFYFIYKD